MAKTLAHFQSRQLRLCLMAKRSRSDKKEVAAWGSHPEWHPPPKTTTVESALSCVCALNVLTRSKLEGCRCGFILVKPSRNTSSSQMEVEANEFPWSVHLIHSGCGGTIINQLWVVTAAHCVNGTSPKDIEVTATATPTIIATTTTENLSGDCGRPRP